ncbi:MAG TPA: putative metal-binding motif-containing protein, partial [Patescibacteria group bacterium]|nr:putative metal-binding motif-containing protein [Patescibacteria group bacterium]
DGDGVDVCAGDCNDNDPAVNPDAPEACNGLDDNCNGEIDEGCRNQSWWTAFTTRLTNLIR